MPRPLPYYQLHFVCYSSSCAYGKLLELPGITCQNAQSTTKNDRKKAKSLFLVAKTDVTRKNMLILGKTRLQNCAFLIPLQVCLIITRINLFTSHLNPSEP